MAKKSGVLDMKLRTQVEATNEVAEGSLRKKTKAHWKIGNLGFALNGVRVAWREERGFRNHVFGALAMITTLAVLQPDAIWWAAAIFSSALLLALELVNTAVERLMDYIDRRFHPAIRSIKDLSAAAVIVASIGVLLLGVVMVMDTLVWRG